MRQEIIKKTYCTFEELSEDRQKEVTDENRLYNVNYGLWSELMMDDFKSKLKGLGFYDIIEKKINFKTSKELKTKLDKLLTNKKVIEFSKLVDNGY